MSSALEDLKGRLGEAGDLLQRAERAGMEVNADQVALRKARDQIVEARVLAHGVGEAKFLGAVQEGIKSADSGVAAGQRAFTELRLRRLDLGASLVVIVR